MKAFRFGLAILCSILFLVLMYGDFSLLIAETAGYKFYIKLLISFAFGFSLVYLIAKIKFKNNSK